MKKTTTIKKNLEFKYLFNKGKWKKAKRIVVYYLKDTNLLNENRVGFVVSKKAGNSVFRNRIRRLFRQAYSDLENRMETGYKIIIMWKSTNKEENIGYQEIYDDVISVFIESGIINV